MGLSNDIIKEFVKITNDTTKPTDVETTVYGTAKVSDGVIYVQLDGSDQLTPVTTTIDVADGDRVTVLVKNHTATITGNISYPGAKQIVVQGYGDQIDAAVANIGDLTANNLVVNNKLEAAEAELKTLKADVADIDAVSTKDLEAINAKIYNLETTYATVDQLDAVNARIDNLDVGGLTADFANIALSNVTVENVGTLFARVGLITDATIQNGKVTGYLDAVEVNANSITAGTLSVDRLVFRGQTDSIVYELNNITGALQAVQGDTLNGEILTDRSITVDKIVAKSITANEIAAGTITATEIAGNTITASKINMTDLVGNSAFINAISTNSVVVGAANAINNLSIGTRNLLYNTNQGTANWAAIIGDGGYSHETVTAFGRPAVKITTSAVSTSYYVWGYTGVNYAALKNGGTYTLSFDIYPSVDVIVGVIYAQANSSNCAGTWGNITCPANVWTHWELTTTFNADPNNGQLIYIMGLNVLGEFIIANMMLVEGTKSGTWTPAPEDVDASINGITSNVFVPGTTTINGGNIATGTINVNDLFSRNITADGTITGVTIVNKDANSLSSIKLTAGKLYTYSSTTGYNGISISGSKLTVYAWDDDGTELGYLASARNGTTGERGTYLLASYATDIGLGVHTSANSSMFTYAIKAHYDDSVGPIILSKSYWQHDGIFEAGCAYLNNTALSISGNLYVSGLIECHNEVICSWPHGGRIAYGDYGAFWRNDGANLYLMFTDKGDPYGSFNGFRPLYFDLQWGNAWFGHNLTVGGALSVAQSISVGNNFIGTLEFQSANPVAFRSAYGTYGAMWYNDGGNYFYLLVTDANNPYGGFNGLRPFYINMASGSANFGHDVAINGTLWCNNQIRIANNVDLYCEDTSGVARSMVAVDGSNIGYLGWGVLPMLKVGCPTNTGRLQLFSKGRIDFLPAGATNANGMGVSIIKDQDQSICMRPTLDATCYLGNLSYRYAGVYSFTAVNVGSDRRFKDDIVDLDDRYVALSQILSTKSYTLNRIKDGKRHVGYIAQDVEAAMASVGLSEEECAFFNKSWVERDDYTGYELSLVYEELHTIQIASLQKQVNELRNDLAIAKAQLEHYQTQQLGS